MVPVVYDPDRIPLAHLVPVPTTAAALAATILGIIYLPAGPALILGLLLLAIVGLHARTRRADRVFLARYFRMPPEAMQIELTLRVLRELMRPPRGAPVPRSFTALTETLESLGEQAFHLGLALRKLDGVRSEEEILLEMNALDERLAACQLVAERQHVHEARRHLMQERQDSQRVELLMRKYQAELIAIHHFFRAATTQVRSLAARQHIGSGVDPMELVQSSSQLLETAQEVQDVVERLEGQTVEELVAQAPALPGVHDSRRCLLEASVPESTGSEGTGEAGGHGLADILEPLKASLSKQDPEDRSTRIRIQKLIDSLHGYRSESPRLCERLLEKAKALNPRADSGLKPRVLLVEAILAVRQDGPLPSAELELLVKLGEAVGIPREDLAPGG